MRQLFVIATLVVSAGLAQAQHGGGGHAGGGAGHAGFSGGGFSDHAGATSQSFSHAAPRFSAPSRASFAQHSRYQQGSADQTGNWTSAGFFPSHSGPVLSRNGNRNSRVGYGGFGYGYPLFGYPEFGYDQGFDSGYSDQNLQGSGAAGYAPAANGYQDGPQEAYAGPGDPGYAYGPPNAARPPYGPAGSSSFAPEQGQSAPGPASDGLQHPKVTLVFADGHTLQVQNYAVTQTKVLVTDNSTVRDIPISALDRNATAAANDAAGVDFTLPSAP